MKKIYNLNVLVIMIFFFLITPFFVKAGSYDAYVDTGYSGEGDGSKSKPFAEISEAVESGARKIFIEKGKYVEKIVLEKSVSLYGKSKSSVIIDGSIAMEGTSSIENITVIGDINIKKNSDVNIESCNIKNFGSIGIDIAPGNGKITVLNSKIYGGGKGIYVQAGNEIKINGNEIYGNSEEGIDIRAKVSGIISENSVHDNGESGIEVIIGSSKVSITGNTIKKNNASGIATQFYKENKKIGNILIENNILSKNNKYGIDCKIPSGGIPSAGYWNNSLNLSGNTIEYNNIDSINNFCDIISALEKEDEEKDNKIIESITVKNNEDSSENLKEEDLDREEDILKNIESIQTEINEIRSALERSQGIANRRSMFSKFIIGSDLKEGNALKERKNRLNEKKNLLEGFLAQAKSEEIKEEISSIIFGVSAEIEKCEKLIDENTVKFSVCGWFLKMFYKEK